MTLNYEGSVAERLMKFATASEVSEDNSVNLFNAISIYIPKSLASDALVSGSYDPTAITATSYAVITANVDNYKQIMKTTGQLYLQWKNVFNEDTNYDVILYLIIFDDTSFSVVTTKSTISWAPLTKAFDELYYISFLKTMYSVALGSTTTDDTNFFDMSLCLAQLCENESKFSLFASELKVTCFDSSASSITDTNRCKIMSKSVADELAGIDFTSSALTQDKRAEQYWGCLKTIAPNRSWVILNNNAIMLPYLIGKWFDEGKNGSGEYVGNKFAKVKLSGSGIKPTGLASPLNSAINQNLSYKVYELLDDKNVGYFISISANSDNDCVLRSDRTLANFPVSALEISKIIDYKTSQELANWYATEETKLCNSKTYDYIKSVLVSNIQKFGGTGRLTNITLKFPAFADVKKGNSIVGTGVWEATYIDDIDSVAISGKITFEA